MGKIVVFCKAPKKLVSRARSKPLFMKSNFKDNYKDKKPTAISEIYEQKGDMTDEEFEKFIIESGARG